MANQGVIKQYFKSEKILFFLGNGGVGKTTLSASVAYLASTYNLKTAIITIDPSKRLAQALGVSDKSFSSSIDTASGTSLDVFLVNPQKEFADFLQKTDPSGVLLKVFEKNKLYQQMVGRLGETQNFSALFLLDKVYQSKKYDLIVVDTPPHQHAIDFLNTGPNIKKIIDSLPKVKTSAFINKILNVGKDSFYNVLSFLTGEVFAQEMKDFLAAFPAVGDSLLKLTTDLSELFVSEQSSVNLVTVPEVSKVVEIVGIANEIKKLNIPIDNLWINRAQPYWLDKGLADPQLKSKWLEQAMTFHKQNLEYIGVELAKSFPNTKNIYLPEFENSDGLGDLIAISKKIEAVY